MISLITAVSANGVIGRGGELPWHLSDDLKRFKQLTMGKPIVMGRKTFDSIGRALPGRQNIVLTKQSEFIADGCDVVSSVDAAVTTAGGAGEIMVIGGSEIYALFLPLANRIYMTRVQVDVDGDTRFPELDDEQWQETGHEKHGAGESNDYEFTTSVLQRISI
jgi:dihydrofolate reductase